MKKLLAKPLFWTNIVAISITGLMVSSIAFGWTNPSATPPSGSGAITATSDGKVGIGTAVPTQKLDVNGYLVARTGDCIGIDDVAVPPPPPSGTALSASSGSTETTIKGAAVTKSATPTTITIVSGTTGLSSTLSYTAPSSALSVSSTLVGGGTRPAAPAPAEISEAYKIKGCRKTWPAYGIGAADSGASASLDSVGIVTKNRIAKFVNDVPGKETVGDSNIFDDNKTVYVASDFSFTGKLVGGSVPWYRITDIPKIDCGVGKVLQGVNPTLCVAYSTITGCTPGPLGGGCTGGSGTPAPPSPTTCTSTVGSGPGVTTGTAICGLTCSTAHITAYSGAGTPFMSAIPPNYICNGKPTLGPSSITCSC